LKLNVKTAGYHHRWASEVPL